MPHPTLRIFVVHAGTETKPPKSALADYNRCQSRVRGVACRRDGRDRDATVRKSRRDEDKYLELDRPQKCAHRPSDRPSVLTRLSLPRRFGLSRLCPRARQPPTLFEPVPCVFAQTLAAHSCGTTAPAGRPRCCRVFASSTHTHTQFASSLMRVLLPNGPRSFRSLFARTDPIHRATAEAREQLLLSLFLCLGVVSPACNCPSSLVARQRGSKVRERQTRLRNYERKLAREIEMHRRVGGAVPRERERERERQSLFREGRNLFATRWAPARLCTRFRATGRERAL